MLVSVYDVTEGWLRIMLICSKKKPKKQPNQRQTSGMTKHKLKDSTCKIILQNYCTLCIDVMSWFVSRAIRGDVRWQCPAWSLACRLWWSWYVCCPTATGWSERWTWLWTLWARPWPRCTTIWERSSSPPTDRYSETRLQSCYVAFRWVWPL